MSTQAKPDFVDEGMTEEAVRDYLHDNPDFFERNSALLDALRVPHVSGDAVSLVERQISVLRQKELKLKRQLKELVDVARSNDTIAEKVHAFSLGLLSAQSLSVTISRIEEAMRKGFGADESVLVLFADPEAFPDIEPSRFFRVIDRASEELKPFSTFLESSGPRCGQIRDSQKSFLFQADAEEIGSVALLPLGKKSELGFLAIGSVSSERFHPGMSIDFLARLGDLVATALERF